MAGIVSDFATGREVRFIAVEETVFNGTDAVPPGNTDYARPAVGGSIAIKPPYSFDVNQPRENRRDASFSRSLFQRITRQKENTFSLEHFVFLPGGDTIPQWGALAKAAMGSEVPTGGTSVVYSLTDTLPSVALHAHHGGLTNVHSEALTGCGINEFTINVPGPEEPIMSYSGMAARHIHTGTATVDTTQVSTTVSVGTANINNFFVDSFVTVLDSGSPVNRIIVSVDRTLGEFVVEGASVDQTSGDAVVAHTPWALTTTQATAGITGDLDLGARTDLQISSFTVTVTNNFTEKRPALKEEMDDLIVGFRDIVGEIGLWGRREDFIELGRRTQFGALPLTVRLGDPTGTNPRMVITMPAIEVMFSTLSVPESEEVTIPLPFVAKATAAGANDEITIVTD